ncbi:MAG: Lon protease family protein, partial [Ignavibacteriales bacterium]
AFFRNLDKRHLMRKYKVNLLVDNSEQKAAPVITETNPNYANLFGSVEYEGEFGVLSTDFTKIRPGAIHKANGGYLILNFMDVISNLMAWETLKRVLKNGEVTIESIMKSLSIGGGEALQPEAIPVEVKVILIGEPMIYYLLYTRDEDFAKLFKIKAEFDSEMERSDDHVMEYASFINGICVEEGLPHFSREAVARVVDHGTWLADDQNKLCTTFNRLRDIIYEASVCAARNEKKVVEAPDVEQAIREKVERSNMVEERLMEAIEDGTILLEITGSRVGELNGLAVYSIGDYMFGKPSRITAKTFMGEKGLVNIEREVRMSGNIHNKGILTLSGYLGDKYAQDKPLSLSASVTFEQTYEGIEGDSASSTELFAIISSLSGLPINQGIAVTGSVNQNGEIQPIGGVNQKIEGFFRVCRIKGLTGNQGVMIPRRNVRNLMLNQEIVDMVKVGRFHIWAINTVDEGIEILMNTPAGTLGSNGQYDRASVHYQVNRRLRELGDLKQLDRRRLQADSVTKRINNRRV